MKYLKSLLIMLISLFISSLIITIPYFFNLISINLKNILLLIFPIISIFISSFYLGKNSKKNGWFEGLKFGLLIIFLFFLLSLIISNKLINFKNIIYYFILLLTSILGSMLGINKNNNNHNL